MDGRLHTRWRTAGLAAFALTIGIAPAPAVADAPGASEAAPATIVSSFAPAFEDRTVVGGTQEITVVAASSGSVHVSVPLAPAPCACDVVSVDAATGTVSGSTWHVGELAPSASASVVVVWARSG